MHRPRLRAWASWAALGSADTELEAHGWAPSRSLRPGEAARESRDSALDLRCKSGNFNQSGRDSRCPRHAWQKGDQLIGCVSNHGCLNKFVQAKDIVTMTTLPPGSKNVTLTVEADEDIDIHVMQGKRCIIGYGCQHMQVCGGTPQSNRACIQHRDQNMFFSGDDRTVPVLEYFWVEEVKEEPIVLMVKAYKPAEAEVRFSFSTLAGCTPEMPLGCLPCDDYPCPPGQARHCDGSQYVICYTTTTTTSTSTLSFQEHWEELMEDPRLRVSGAAFLLSLFALLAGRLAKPFFRASVFVRAWCMRRMGFVKDYSEKELKLKRELEETGKVNIEVRFVGNRWDFANPRHAREVFDDLAGFLVKSGSVVTAVVTTAARDGHDKVENNLVDHPDGVRRSLTAGELVEYRLEMVLDEFKSRGLQKQVVPGEPRYSDRDLRGNKVFRCFLTAELPHEQQPLLECCSPRTLSLPPNGSMVNQVPVFVAGLITGEEVLAPISPSGLPCTPSSGPHTPSALPRSP